MKRQHRSRSIGGERHQVWNDPLRRRARLSWGDEGLDSPRSEQELCELDDRRELDERSTFRPRESSEVFERRWYAIGREHDWRDRERDFHLEREREVDGPRGWPRQDDRSEEDRSGNPTWDDRRSSREPRFRGGRSRFETRYERPVARRRHHHGFSGVADWGANLGFSGGTASLGFGEDMGEAPGISAAPGISGATLHLDAPAPRRRGLHAGKGPKDFRRSDERLREEVFERLRADPDIDASEIVLEVKDGEVTLEGSVPDRQTKRDAVDCVESVMGVCQVNNRLRISG